MSHKSSSQVDRRLSEVLPDPLCANVFWLGNIMSILRLSSRGSIVSLGQTVSPCYILDHAESRGNPMPLKTSPNPSRVAL